MYQIETIQPRVGRVAVLAFLIVTVLAPGVSAQVFEDSGQALGNESSTDVRLGDVDRDGDLDAFVVNGTNFSEADKVWLNDGYGKFSDSGQSLGNSPSNGVSLGDLDGDGDLDAFEVGPNRPHAVWLNNGAGGFTQSESLGSSDALQVALGDLDGDGDLDAFVANGAEATSGSPNQVWINGGHGSFSLAQSLGDRGSDAVGLGDLDGDGDLDALVAHRSAGNSVWLNGGSAFFVDTGQVLGGQYSLAVALGDLDRDGDLDVFVAKQLNQPDEVWLNDGHGVFSDSGQRLGLNDGRRVALGDVDGDGDLDAFVANTGPQPDNVWLNDGSGVFSLGQAVGNSTSKGVGLGDLDGDGDLDAFVVANGFPSLGEPNRVWLNRLVERIRIDIKPGSFPNSINPRSKGVIPVAILTTHAARGELRDFDSATVDVPSLRFGPSSVPAAGPGGHLEDVDGDGDLDLMLHFATAASGITCADKRAVLSGRTILGQQLWGSDSIRPVGCR